ncbi:unnamed protein product [Auanema sp. JU1783]|nr:unnamed protein product [Auanema sp. JU1783]
MLQHLILLSSLVLISYQYATVEQVHLSWNGNPGEMTVTWITKKPLGTGMYPYVRYGSDQTLSHHVRNATTTKWKDHGESKVVRYTYRATMEKLTTGTRYYYAVGSDEKFSNMFNFMPIDQNKNVKAAIFGDFSVDSGYSMDLLTNSTHEGDFDIIFHIGDLAYNLQDKEGATGDDFMNAIENIAAYVPYMVIAGNHEYDRIGEDFNHYKHRFTMPSNGKFDDNQFWSFNIGDVHFVGISTEYYGYKMSSEAQAQYEWLHNDLKLNSHKAWTVLFMHRPMYCSNKEKTGCEFHENLMTRVGSPGYPALEPLFNDAGVDMVFWGHEHTYQRNYPVYELKSFEKQDVDHFHNAATPVYTLTGAAGCHSHQKPVDEIQQKFTAAMLGNYGFSLLSVKNTTEIHTYFVDAKTDKHLDKFKLTKTLNYKPGQHVH